jgi:hypothetical protein
MAKKSKAEAPTPVHITEETVPAKLNKSAEIRKEAERIKERTGEKPRPKDIVATLKSRGIEVAPAQVSGELKKMGFKPRPRKTKSKISAQKTVAPKAAENKPAKNTSGSFTVEELKAANKFVKTIGDAARAVELMDAMFGG